MNHCGPRKKKLKPEIRIYHPTGWESKIWHGYDWQPVDSWRLYLHEQQFVANTTKWLASASSTPSGNSCRPSRESHTIPAHYTGPAVAEGWFTVDKIGMPSFQWTRKLLMSKWLISFNERKVFCGALIGKEFEPSASHKPISSSLRNYTSWDFMIWR